MSSEEQELLAKIGQVSGQINRHKYTQDSTSSVSYRQSPYPQYPVHSSRGSMVSPTQFDKRATDRSGDFAGRRGGGIRSTSRGAYSMRGRGHRNRTLVLNGNPPNAENQSTVTSDENESPSAASATPPSYITKIDRHNIQLINSSVYEKNSQIRTKAIEETRQQKLKQRNDREKLKFHKHLQHMGNSSASYPAGNTSGYQIDIHGILFNVAKNGSKLVKVPGERSQTTLLINQGGEQLFGLSSPQSGDINYGKATPKTALVGGVHFHRSKNGNMYRSGVVKAYRRSGVVKKVNEPCKIFTTTGSCSKGPKCRYIHDLSKVAVCKDFLQKGSCPSGDSCDLSHDLTPERTPACLHFGKGNCANPNCRYTHVHVSPNALNCRAFGVYGYCEKGASCAERHAFECPEFANTGNCTTKGCKLLHRYKASVMRRNLAGGETGSAEDNSDISSDDEDEIDSDDVDSDDLLEEYFGDDDGKTDTDVPMQQDFVHFA